MRKKRIAVVSTDGVFVNEHFGRADHFLIYDRTQVLTLAERRGTETWSTGDPDHAFDASKFERICHRLEDCARIYMTKIGEMPAARLKEMGIEPVVYTGKIADIPVFN